MRFMLFLHAFGSIMLQHVLNHNDWRVLVVLFIITSILAGPAVPFIGFVLTLVVFAIYDKECREAIGKEYHNLFDDRKNKL